MSSQQEQAEDTCKGCHELKTHFEKVTTVMKAKIDMFEKQIRKLMKQKAQSQSSTKASRQTTTHSAFDEQSLSSVLDSVENIPPVESSNLMVMKSEVEDTYVDETLKEDDTQKLLAIISAQFDGVDRTPNVSKSSPPAVYKDDEMKCCSNCFTSNSTAWRRDENGHRLCNPCGVYLKRNKAKRPLKLHQNPMRKRPRSAKIVEQETKPSTEMPQFALDEFDSLAQTSPSDFLAQLNQLMEAE